MNNLDHIQAVLNHLQMCADYYTIQSITCDAIAKYHHPAIGWVVIILNMNTTQTYHSMSDMCTFDIILKDRLSGLSWELKECESLISYSHSYELRIQLN